MYRVILPALLPLGALTLHAQQEAPSTHQEAARQLIELLVQTEACLASCTDAATVQAALPRLRELAEQANQLKLAQAALPEPTTQDYLAAQELLGAFNTTWKAVRDHISRLEKAELISPEMREILHIAPED